MANEMGGPGHLFRFSQLLGPLDEWFIYDVAEEGEYFEAVFQDTMENILRTEPGEYDDLPWYLSEKATERLDQNS